MLLFQTTFNTTHHHERNRARAGWPVRQPDRCQVLGDHQVSQSGTPLIVVYSKEAPPSHS